MKAIQVIELLKENNLSLLLEIAEREYQEDLAKQLGKPKLLTTIKKIMRENKNNAQLQGYIFYNDKYYFTDGTRLLESDVDFGYSECTSKLDLSKAIPPIYSYNKQAEIDVKELKLLITENKEIAKKNKEIKKQDKCILSRKLIDIKPYIVNDEIGFSPIKLLEHIEAIGSTTIHYSEPLKPAYIGDNHNNIILPWRIK